MLLSLQVVVEGDHYEGYLVRKRQCDVIHSGTSVYFHILDKMMCYQSTSYFFARIHGTLLITDSTDF